MVASPPPDDGLFVSLVEDFRADIVSSRAQKTAADTLFDAMGHPAHTSSDSKERKRCALGQSAVFCKGDQRHINGWLQTCTTVDIGNQGANIFRWLE